MWYYVQQIYRCDNIETDAGSTDRVIYVCLERGFPLLQQQAVLGFKALFAVKDLTCNMMFNQFTGVTTLKQMLDQLIGLYMSALKEDSSLLQQQAVLGFKALFAVNHRLACDIIFN